MKFLDKIIGFLPPLPGIVKMTTSLDDCSGCTSVNDVGLHSWLVEGSPKQK